MESLKNTSVNYSVCLVCNSSVFTPEIKVETCTDQDDNKSIIIFLLNTILEIPENEVVQQQEKLVNWEVNTSYCETCTKLIFSAKHIYTEILKLSRKFRKVQKQIVEQISDSREDFPHGTTTLSTCYNNELLGFCRNFLNKHDFNGFDYPFVVNEKPVKNHEQSLRSFEEPPLDEVKEEPVSEDDNNDEESCDDRDDDYFQEDNLQNSASSPSAAEDSQSESDSDSEPQPPPPKKPVKKSPSSPQIKVKRKAPSPSSAAPSTQKPPRSRKKPKPPKKQSRFDRLYPNYPKRVRNPSTKLFHCSEPSCSKTYNRKTRMETHIMIEHLQDNYFKCGEPLCGKSYSNPENYQDHVSWHAGIPRWKCEERVTTTPPDGSSGTVQCSEEYYSRKKLIRHVQQVHQKDKPFICETCGQTFNCQAYLTTHKANYHSDKCKEKTSQKKNKIPQICDICGKSYSTRPALETHINLVHDKTVGKLGCQFCEEKFNSKIFLKMHCWRKHKFSLEGFKPRSIKRKEEDKTYKCDVKRCKRVFLREETWRKHMEDKHGEGKEEAFEFNCKFCGTGFHLKWKLEYHEEAHVNKESKPYSCEICGNRFARMPYLKLHRKNVHKIPMERARTKIK